MRLPLTTVPISVPLCLSQSCSIAISTFQDFQLTTLQQRPDSVLRRQRLPDGHLPPNDDAATVSPTTANQLVKMAVWGISATLGAAALAVAQTAFEWGPDLLLQLF